MAGPANEIAFDGIALGMGADDAAASVAGEVGRKVGCDQFMWGVRFYKVGVSENLFRLGDRVCVA
jgi:hypothetical protein